MNSEIEPTQIAAAWVNDKLVSGPIIKRYQMIATTVEEEAEGQPHVKTHERVVIDLGLNEKGQHNRADIATQHVLIK